MPIPSTITLNVGSPAADVVFTDSIRQGLKLLQNAASPQGDLAGQPSLRVEHETTSKGIVRSLVQIRVPQYDSETKSYPKTVQVNVVTTRPDTVSTAECDRVLEMAQELLAVSGVRAALGAKSI